MWYVLRCQPGEEEQLIHSLRQHIPNRILKDAFVFTYDRMKRYHGAWHVESASMFPDYVFLESDSDKEKELSGSLQPYREIVQVMEDKEVLWRVSQEEEEFLRFLCGQNHHLDISKGYIRDGVTHVAEGPLKGMENRICKIDRHKRIARLEAPAGYTDAGSIMAGLEIVEKN